MPQIPQIIANGPAAPPSAPQMPFGSPVGEALQGFGEKMAAIATAIDRNQTATDANNALTIARANAMQARIDARSLPPDQQLAAFDKATDPTALYSDPRNERIAPFLQAHIPEMLQAFRDDVQLHAAAKKEEGQKADAAAFMKVGPTQFVEAPDALNRQTILGQRQHTLDTLENTGVIQHNQRLEMEQQWDKDVALAQGFKVLSSGGNIGDFLKSPAAAAIGGAEKIELLSKSLQIEDFAKRKVDTDMGALQAKTFNDFVQQKANGTVDEAAVMKARDAKLITPEMADFVVGRHLEGPEVQTNPAVKADLTSRIDKAPSAFAIDSIIGGLSGTRGLSESDKGRLRAYAEHAKTLIESPAKQAEIDFDAKIKDYYAPKGIIEKSDFYGVLHSAARIGEAAWDAGVAKLKAEDAGPDAYRQLFYETISKHKKPAEKELFTAPTAPVPTTSATPVGVPALSPEEIMSHGRSLAP